MTRSNLIDEIAEKTERTNKEAEQMLDAVLATITGALRTSSAGVLALIVTAG